jgi:hypothetical protein
MWVMRTVSGLASAEETRVVIDARHKHSSRAGPAGLGLAGRNQVRPAVKCRSRGRFDRPWTGKEGSQGSSYPVGATCLWWRTVNGIEPVCHNAGSAPSEERQDSTLGLPPQGCRRWKRPSRGKQTMSRTMLKTSSAAPRPERVAEDCRREGLAKMTMRAIIQKLGRWDDHGARLPFVCPVRQHENAKS